MDSVNNLVMATINKASKVNDVSCENISKIDDVLKSNIRYFDNNDFSCEQTTPTPTPTPTITPTSTPPSVTPTPTPATCIQGTIPKDVNYEYKDCCYPYGQITGTSGGAGLTVCFNTTGYRLNVTAVEPTEVCDTSLLTSCCEIELGYNAVEPTDACNATLETYYISDPCLVTTCRLDAAFAVYTDDSCTTLADDGYYSDGSNYGTQSGGVFTFNGSC